MSAILKGLIIVEYKLCGVSKAYKVILKRQLTQSLILFYKIYFNLIRRIAVYNSNWYVVYFLDNITWLNDIEVMAKKLSLP